MAEILFFFSSRRRHTRFDCDWSSDVCSSDLMVTKVREGKPSAFSVIDLNFAMKEIAEWALNIAALRGASYADARIVDERSRALATKNGKIGSASDVESLGIGIRVIADGAWGFAASDNLSRE